MAVVNNPLYTTTEATNAFDNQEGLDHLPNWTYLTGSAQQLHQVWNDYGVQTLVDPGRSDDRPLGHRVHHRQPGHTREILNSDPGDGTTSSRSSFSTLLSAQLQHFVHP